MWCETRSPMWVLKPLHGGNPHLNEGTKTVNVKYLDLRKAMMRTKICTNIFSHKWYGLRFNGDESHGIPIRQKITQQPNPKKGNVCSLSWAISDHEMNFYTPEIQQLKPLKAIWWDWKSIQLPFKGWFTTKTFQRRCGVELAGVKQVPPKSAIRLAPFWSERPFQMKQQKSTTLLGLPANQRMPSTMPAWRFTVLERSFKDVVFPLLILLKNVGGEFAGIFGTQDPIASMRLARIFTYIYNKNRPNVGKYTIHGSYGTSIKISKCHLATTQIQLATFDSLRGSLPTYL